MYWGISYTVGLGALGLYFIIYFKRKDIADLNVLIFDLNMTGIVISLSLLSILPSKELNTLNIVGYFAYLLSGALIYTLPRFSHSTRTRRFNKKLNNVFLYISLALIGMQLMSIFLIEIPYITHITMWVMGGAIAYSMINMILPSKEKSFVKRGKYHLLLGLFTLIVLPLLFLIDFFPSILNIPGHISNSFSIFPGFYLLLNLGLISAIKGSLYAEPQCLDQFYEKFNITTREAEVLSHLSKGLSYKSIAEELHISLSTVKTHVSRLYQKTSTTNKLEIIAIMNKSYKSTT